MKSYNSDLKEIIKILTEKNETVSCMESCTGGGLANAITSIEGASSVLKFSAVTYSNEYKIKMGVSEEIISKYSVYSAETAKEMSEKISDFTSSDYGIGITGKLNRADENNLSGDDDIVYISIYDKENNTYYNDKIKVIYKTREENKQYVINKVIELLGGIL